MRRRLVNHAWRIAALGVLLVGSPAHALRIASYNLHEYPQTNGSVRHPAFRTVMAGLNADVLVVQEISTDAGVDSFLTGVLQLAEPAKRWKRTGYIASTESALFYDSLKVQVTNVAAVGTAGPRDVLWGTIQPNGYGATQAGTLRVYSVHYKAGTPTSSTTDSTTRRLECTDLRNALNSLIPGTNLLVGGDTNFYGSWEGGYIRLTESQLDNDGRLKDTVALPGTWNNSGYAAYHSQSPCNSGCGTNFAGGGLDDRFDFWLSSFSLQDGEGFDLVSQLPYGNDGQHYNQDVNGLGFNNAVGLTIATALHDASDHLPALYIVQLPPKAYSESQLDFGTALIGSTATRTLHVSDIGAVPADELDYHFAGPPGFIVPGGSFVVNADAAASPHTITLDTAAEGTKSGAMLLTSDDPDTLSKQIKLSGLVVRHAVGSLESLTVAPNDTLDLGGRTSGNFIVDIPARVFNNGYNALQSKLSVTNGVLTGGEGRFSMVGGFSPALVADQGAAYPIHFDDTGATLDSTYHATLTFSVSDEPFPGAASGSLVLTIRARVVSGTTGVGPVTPTALRFYPPRPNPVARSTRFAFDLPRAAAVSLDIFDLSGRRVAQLVSGGREAGHHEVSWQSSDMQGGRLAGGLYFARFRADGLSRMERLILLP